eukprot:3049501-Amphidinium_carterae.1
MMSIGLSSVYDKFDNYLSHHSSSSSRIETVATFWWGRSPQGSALPPRGFRLTTYKWRREKADLLTEGGQVRRGALHSS